MRIGMIGLDTSHVVEFTKIFQNPQGHSDLADIQVVAGFPGGSEVSISRSRVDEFSAQLAGLGVEIVHSIPEVLERVDAVMLESVDGSVHLSQALAIAESKLPLFIDKPIAGSLSDAMEIQQLVESKGIACFSASSLRFSPSLQQALADPTLGEIKGVETWGPCHLQDNVPDFYFYGIHGIEAMFTVMGRGCVQVQRTHLPDTDIVVGIWKDGRVGTYRGIRGGSLDFGATLFGTQRNQTLAIEVPYRELCIAIARFFKTGIAPVSLAETIELYAFLEACDESKRSGGSPISL